MKMIRLNSLVAILIAVFLLASCKKDKDDNGYIKPSTATAEIVKVPQAIATNTSDPNVMMINSYAQMVNAFGSMSQLMAAVPGNAEKTELKTTGVSWHWSYSQGDYTVNYWLEMYEEELGTRWKLYIQGSGYEVKTLVVEAYEDDLGAEGWMKIYAPGYASPVVTYNWAKLNGNVTASILFSYEGESIYFAFTGNSDGSGTMKVYYGSNTSALKIVDLTWNASGHGTWWVKDPDSGTTASGEF